MTTAQMAKRLGVSQPRIPQLEKAEMEGTVTLKTLRQAAEAINCTLTYVLVPNQPLDQMLRERAGREADRLIARTGHTMALENQALDPSDLKSEHARLVAELVAGDPRRLWDTV